MINEKLNWTNAQECIESMAALATSALIDEAELTPKPGLVDLHSNGAHTDLNFDLMCLSAKSLQTTFADMAAVAHGSKPSQQLRESLACIGRNGEKVMLEATGGVNTHRGAIWALGLLTAAAAIAGYRALPSDIARIAGEISRFPDRFAPVADSHGLRVRRQFGTSGARGEAHQGFPHVVKLGLPALLMSRSRRMSETHARLDSLLAIMAHLEDTCLLHRGGIPALHTARQGARSILSVGGTSVNEGWLALRKLDTDLVALHASPGGSADLLAAVLFLDRISAQWMVKD
jgi:triphosphoribosyl-dephospho-CoA synthase